jgi:predicted anti-sigma-YlaC factor YlaD
MRCKDAYLMICDSLNQPSNSKECRAVRRHLQNCKDCSAYLESLQTTIQLYKSSAPTRTPISVHKRLMKRLSAIEKPARKHS